MRSLSKFSKSKTKRPGTDGSNTNTRAAEICPSDAHRKAAGQVASHNFVL